MKLLKCPDIGARPVGEFIWGGKVTQLPDLEKASDQDWAEYLLWDDIKPEEIMEWWIHRPSGIWYISMRNTQTDKIISVYPASSEFIHHLHPSQNKDDL